MEGMEDMEGMGGRDKERVEGRFWGMKIGGDGRGCTDFGAFTGWRQVRQITGGLCQGQ